MKKITPIIILLLILGLVVSILSLAEKGENEQVRSEDPCEILGNCGEIGDNQIYY